MILAFTVLGSPVPKGRPRLARARAYTPARIRAYEAHVAQLAQSALASLPAWNPAGPHDLFVRVFCAGRGGDPDNFVKCCADALVRGGVVEDHRSIERTYAILGTDKARPRLEVEVWCQSFAPLAAGDGEVGSNEIAAKVKEDDHDVGSTR